MLLDFDDRESIEEEVQVAILKKKQCPLKKEGCRLYI